MLLQRDEDAKSEVNTNKEEEIISTITFIFQNIKYSEDIVDTSKSKVEDKYILICDSLKLSKVKVIRNCNLTFLINECPEFSCNM